MTSRTTDVKSGNAETDLIELLKSGDSQAFNTLIRKYNQRLFRIARSIVGDNMEAEDVVQEAYIKAFTHLNSLDTSRDQKHLGAWLARITTNLSIDRTRKAKRSQKLVDDLLNSMPAASEQSAPSATPNSITPERQAAMSQIRVLLEREIDNLPDGFREVFVLRIVEELSTEETANILQIPIATVKTKLHRARAKLQDSIKMQLNKASLNVFPFAGARCNRITKAVLCQLQEKDVIQADKN